MILSLEVGVDGTQVLPTNKLKNKVHRHARLNAPALAYNTISSLFHMTAGRVLYTSDHLTYSISVAGDVLFRVVAHLDERPHRSNDYCQPVAERRSCRSQSSTRTSGKHLKCKLVRRHCCMLPRLRCFLFLTLTPSQQARLLVYSSTPKAWTQSTISVPHPVATPTQCLERSD